MNRRFRVLCIALALMACASYALFATGAKEGTAGTAAASQKEVHLYGYLLGAPLPGMADVMTALNAKLKKDLNVTMEINYLGWADYQSKYPLVLAAGENIDWIYTASWCMYATQAVRGAFYELSPAVLAKNMPLHYKKEAPTAWKQALVSGKIYMIPTSTPDRKIGSVALIRGDLRKKYGLPEITKMSQMEPYLKAVQQNEPGMIPMNIEQGYDLGVVFNGYRNELTPPYNWAISGAVPYIYNYQASNPKVMTELDGDYADGFVKAANFVKDWYDKGYFNKDVFANKVRSKEAFEQGKSAVGFGNSIDTQGNITKAIDSGFEVEIIPLLDSTGHYPADSFINNGLALAATTKNAERTLQALDLMMEDPAYVYLVYFGIEGKNYVITSDGKIGLPPGVTNDQNTYPIDQAGFWWVDKDLFKPLASWPPAYIALNAKIPGMLFTTPYSAFGFIPDAVKTEIANVTQVWQQYEWPLQVGMVNDVSQAIATVKDKLAAANSQKVQDEIQRQMDAFGAGLK
ncbi:MAG: ABC transporter substrate-binding protein [Spirochaetia bacterium]